MSELSIFQLEQLDEWVALELKKRPNADCGVLAADATLSGAVKGVPSPCISHWEIVESISRVTGGNMPKAPGIESSADLREPENENTTKEGNVMKQLDGDQIIVLDDWVLNAVKQYPDAIPKWLAGEANKRQVLKGIEINAMQIVWSKRRLKKSNKISPTIATHKPGQPLKMYTPKKHCWRRGEKKPAAPIPKCDEEISRKPRQGASLGLREPANLDLNEALSLIDRIVSDFEKLPSSGRSFVLNQISKIE